MASSSSSTKGPEPRESPSSHASSPPPLWDPESVPPKDSDEFLNLVSYAPRPADSPFVPNESLCTRWREPPNPRTLASLGDNGVTASINAAGELIQFSAYLGVGTSAMFAASYAELAEPYWMQNRADELFQYGRDFARPSFGLKLPHRWEDVVFEGYHCDRWPVYTCADERLAVRSTWMVHEGTVLQRMHIDSFMDEDLQLPLDLLVNMEINELEHVNPGHKFNEKGKDFERNGPNGCGWIVTNKLETENDGGVDIAVLLSIFIDGRPVMPNPLPEPGYDAHIMIKVPAEGRGPEIVVAYRMITLPKTTEDASSSLRWQDLVIPGEAADFDKHLEEAEKLYRYIDPSELDSRKPQEEDGKEDGKEDGEEEVPVTQPTIELTGFPTDGKSYVQYIDHITRRNLEHILSVCVVPIPNSSDPDAELIALTCGDLSGHRVTSSASYFAFSFLVEMAKRLQNPTHPNVDDTFQHLRSRIERVCEGHMRWLRKATKTRTDCFAANYWVNGTLMNTDSPSDTPNDSHTDTAFQLLKALEFRDMPFADEYVRDRLANNLLREVAMRWVRVLHRVDKRKVCAWTNAKVEGSDKYRLSNNFWIWKALRGIESSLPAYAVAESGGGHRNDVDEDDTDEKIIKRLTAGNVQKEILRRFTTWNDNPNKRMLAMTRSSRETRFLLHASDTSLFYGQDQNFFLRDTPFNELWQNTLEAQPHHKENNETGWENLIRYALAVMMGTRSKKINERLPPDLVKSSINVLLRATSATGLFYGVIDGTTKEPDVFQYEFDMDFYYHASFEIPFILLTHCWKIAAAVEEADKMAEERPHLAIPTDQNDGPPKEAAPKPTAPEMKRRSYTPGDVQGKSTETTPGPKRDLKTVPVKKSQPFNSLFDQSSIVELNEEWLYNYPSFFMRDDADHHLDESSLPAEIQKIADSHRGSDDAGGSIVFKAAKELAEKQPEEYDPETRGPNGGAHHWVGYVDVPKQKRGRKRGTLWMESLNLQQLWWRLTPIRTARKAKKRLLWMQRPVKTLALMSYIASHEDERPGIATFFERHASFENYFFEDVTAALNEWDSELHLSFYQLKEDGDKDGGNFWPYPNSKDEPQAVALEQHVSLLPGKDSSRSIVRASIGFRFYGDFFDRHWTCYLAEHIQDMSQETPISADLVQQQSCWQQRKVLELNLFDRMIREIIQSTEQILVAIRLELGVERGSFLSPVLNSDDYFTSSARWQKSQQILEIIDEELSNIITTVGKWDTRERDRGHERPRWTRNDERKYRLVIRKLEGTNRRRVRDLKKQHERLKLLKETLVKSQDQIRDDLSLRGAENIRFFTYVTVVFLPLGFAASVFSMSEVPPVTDILRGMVVCAFIALFITIMMLANAKKLNSGLRNLKGVVVVLFRPLSTGLTSFSSQSRRNSPLDAFGLKPREPVEKQKDEEASIHSQAEGSKAEEPKQVQPPVVQHRRPGATRFWLTYVFLEFPARKVLRAFFTARNPVWARWSTYTSFIWGIVLLPLFCLSYPLYIAFLNVVDISRICWRFLTEKMRFPDDDFQETQEFKDRLSHWVQPPLKYRPLRNTQLPPTNPEAKVIEHGMINGKLGHATTETTLKGS